jgi:alkanesulfonate monooxygenase
MSVLLEQEGPAEVPMLTRPSGQAVRVFSTCPPSHLAPPAAYIRHAVEVARWSEAAGHEGMLVYTDNGLVDPWLVAQSIIDHTERLCPLIAVQPMYMHPYAVAKMVASLGFLYGRRVYLNMVAGGFKNDLNALNDPTPHDERYARLIEYTSIVMALLESREPLTRRGRYYSITNLRMTPPLPADLVPGVFVSGSSPAGLEAARALEATAVQYPKPALEYTGGPAEGMPEAGIRLGIIARDNGEEAWAVAHARFPVDRKGQLTHQLAMKVSDSVWHKQLTDLGKRGGDADPNPYWLVPFENYASFCPYLVGSYHRVAGELARYISAGFRTFILDVPPSPEELFHIRVAFERAWTCAT